MSITISDKMIFTQSDSVNRHFEVCKEFEDSEISLPVRSTADSVGYDFQAAADTLVPSLFKSYANYIAKEGQPAIAKPTLIPTGVKANFPKSERLELFNRSSNPGKKGLLLANGTGIIESDYFENESNDGHIMFAFWNMGFEDVLIKKGEAVGQGVFSNFYITKDDQSKGERTGGFGSTDK